MPTPLPALVRHIADSAHQVSDGEYLRRFVEERDQDAFAELVRRNGPLVLRVCRTVLRDPAAADDAFQTTFLQLTRHAAQLTAVSSAAGWLHTAAVRAAGAIRRTEGRRRRHEHQARPVPGAQSPADVTWLEVREAIDAELARLPERYRLPLLLCYVEGLTYSDAAVRLGETPGALRGRLERGRQWLQRRLLARGLPAVALTLGAGGTPAVSAGLHDRTLAAVRALVPRPNVFVNGVALTSPRHALGAVCITALLAIGVGLAALFDPAEPPKTISPTVPSGPAAGDTKTSEPLRDVFGDPLPKGAIARLGTRRFLQYSRTRDFALSPDGKTIAVGDESLSLMDAVTGQVLRRQASVRVGCDYTMPGQEGGLTTPGIFWRPDGHGVALVGRDSWDKYLWDFTDPKDVPPTFDPNENDVRRPEPPEGAISCAAVSADGKWVAIARQPSDPARRVVQIFPCKTGQQLRDLKADRALGPFTSASERIWFAADGRELILARADRTVVAIDATTGKELRRATLPKWVAIAASPDGKFVAIVPRHPKRDTVHTGDEVVRVWDLSAEKEVWTFPRPGDSITRFVFTPDSKHLATSDALFEFRKWDLTSGKEGALHVPFKGRDSGAVVAISGDGKRYATGRSFGSVGGEIKVWDFATGAQLNLLATHRDSVGGVAVSPDSHFVATHAYDGTLRVWQITNGKQVWASKTALMSPQYRSRRRVVAFTPDGRGIVFDSAGTLSMVDAATGKSRDLPGGLKDLTGYVGGFSADGKTLVTFHGDATTTWDWPAGTTRRTVRASLEKPSVAQRPIRPLVVATVEAVLSPDGTTLFTATNQQNVAEYGAGTPNSTDCWDVKTGTRRYRFAPDLWYPHLAFSPDGRILYATGTPTNPKGFHEDRLRRDGLAAWDATTGSVIRRFDVPEQSPGTVHTPALSPDGRLLATSEQAGKRIGIYETASGKVVRHFEGHTRFVFDLAFAPDGSKLVSASHDYTGLVWDVALRTFTDRPPGMLTAKEVADSWGRLAAPDPVLGWRAVADLVGSPTQAVSFLADRLKPLPVPTAADLDRIEKQLAAPGFEDREKASAELGAFGPTAVAAVKGRLRTTESPEVVRRFTEFLRQHAGEHPSPLTLRGVRGVQVLEAIDLPEVRKILAALAKCPDDPIGNEATMALARLKKPVDPK